MKTLILVIDDNETEGLLVRHFLRKYQVEVIQVITLPEAIKFLEKTLPDLIILDLNIPAQGEGFELLRKRVGLPWLSSIPVIVSSGRGDLDAIQRSITCGANGYLIKGITEKKLLTEIKKAGIKLTLKKD
jgi:CheY-like chemotaxis protein